MKIQFSVQVGSDKPPSRKRKLMRYMGGVVILLIALSVVATACSGGGTNATASGIYTQQQQTVNAYMEALVKAEPYPLAAMKDSTERAQLAERLLRFNDPNRVGYLYLLNNLGQPYGYFVVKGKVSSANSQMTQTNSVIDACGSGCTDRFDIASPADDGSYGPNENAVFFFTAGGVMVQIPDTVLYVYSDAPLPIKVPNLQITLGDNVEPTGGDKGRLNG